MKELNFFTKKQTLGQLYSLQVLLAFVILPIYCNSQPKKEITSSPTPTSSTPSEIKFHVKYTDSVIALTNLRVIKGDGKTVSEIQTIIIAGNKIQSIQNTSNAQIPPSAKIINLKGHTALPGLIGMHNHLFYPSFIDDNGKPSNQQMNFSFPRLYLAFGVTTIRTAGGSMVESEINLKHEIDSGISPGPRIYITSPFMEGPGGIKEMPVIRTENEAEQFVNFWADRGINSIKLYTHLSPNVAMAASRTAKQRNLKVLGHLCTISFDEAIEMGVNDLQHGFVVNTGFAKNKRHGQCPGNSFGSLANVYVQSEQANQLIQKLIKKNIAVTSTLAIFENYTPQPTQLTDDMLAVLCQASKENVLKQRQAVLAQGQNGFDKILEKEMKLEYAFVKAGGLLLSGVDPGGNGATLPGFGDHRQIELLVKAGFSPLEAIKIATYNGALYLNELNNIGTLESGKLADILIVQGNPVENISDIRNVKLVFKNGYAYDQKILLNSVKGQVGFR